jgi:hypothetical protein
MHQRGTTTSTKGDWPRTVLAAIDLMRLDYCAQY